MDERHFWELVQDLRDYLDDPINREGAEEAIVQAAAEITGLTEAWQAFVLSQIKNKDAYEAFRRFAELAKPAQEESG